MMITAASMSPVTRAVLLSSTRSVAVTLPVISPCTITLPARTAPLMRPRSPTMRVSLDSSSPRSRPLNITVPAHR